MKSIESDTRLKVVTRKVRLDGIRPIMFDRYAGDNQTKLSWQQKIYLVPGTSTMCIPALNIVSSLTAINTMSFTKRLREPRKYQSICRAILSFTSIGPEYIPILRNGKPIEVGPTINDEHDPLSGLFLHRAVARLDKGIPNPKERPVLPLPWEIEFELSIFPNKEVKETDIQDIIEGGGLALGMGTWRGVFGKFVVSVWE